MYRLAKLSRTYKQMRFREELQIGNLIYDLTGSKFGTNADEQTPEHIFALTVIESLDLARFIP